MKIGIFVRTFVRPHVVEALDAAASHGFDLVQFNFVSAGVSSHPQHIDPSLLDTLQRELVRRRIRLAAVSGTFNLIHPDPVRRREGLGRFRGLLAACRRLGAPVLTLCTGTRDPDDPWKGHPDNARPEAWRDLRESLAAILPAAEEHRVTLAFEPETANVVDSARKGRQLLDEMKSPRLKVVMDAANLFRPGELFRMRETLDEAFHLLGRDIVMAHSKDVRPGVGPVAAGQGVLDYDHYLNLLRALGPELPLMLHSLAEREVPGAIAFLRTKMNGVKAPAEALSRGRPPAARPQPARAGL